MPILKLYIMRHSIDGITVFRCLSGLKDISSPKLWTHPTQNNEEGLN